MLLAQVLVDHVGVTASPDGLAAVGAGVLGASRDGDYAVRAMAGRFLVAGLGDPQVEQALRRLVDDADDTAVSQEVARALVADGGATGLRLLLSCLAGMDTLDSAAHWVLDGMNAAWSEGGEAGDDAVLHLVNDCDLQVAAGARWVREEQERSRAAAAAPRRKRRRPW